MQQLDGLSLAVQATADVHQASRVGGDDTVRAGREDAAHLVIDHIARDLRVANRKLAAKTAALILPIELHVLRSLNVLHKLLDFIRLAQHP